MTTATVFSWVLAAAPQPNEFVDAIDHVEMVGASGEIVIWAFDANGQAIGAMLIGWRILDGGRRDAPRI